MRPDSWADFAGINHGVLPDPGIERDFHLVQKRETNRGTGLIGAISVGCQKSVSLSSGV